MKIALPLWENRISPVLDEARGFLIVEFQDGVEIDRRTVNLPAVSLSEKVKFLLKEGVDRIICGAVSNPLYAMLEANGVYVHPWCCGRVEELLKAVQENRLTDPRFIMPGCGKGRGRRRRRGRGRSFLI